MINKYIINGNVPSKSNCYKVIKLGRGDKAKCSLGKQSQLKSYENSFKLQMLEYKYELIESEFKFIVDVYYNSRRPDLDNSFKVVLDMLQKCKLIRNDNRCIEIQAKKHLDKENPRIEFSIIPL
jgi:Holliday junction resolvase RusA-like endonuclease